MSESSIALKKIADHGIHLHQEPQGRPGRRWFSVLDPDGHEIVFGEKI